MDAPTPEPRRSAVLDLDLALISVLRAYGPVTQFEAADVLGAHPYSVTLALMRLHRRGRVRRLEGTARPSGGAHGTGGLPLWTAAPDAN